MAKWKYTLRWGKQLREAIHDEDTEMVVKFLIACYHELLNKLSDEDKDWQYDIEDGIACLENYDGDDEEELDYFISEFYDICDAVGAWVSI